MKKLLSFVGIAVLFAQMGLAQPASSPIKAEATKLKQLQSSYEKAKAAYSKAKAKPSSKEGKAYVAATVKYGTAVMNAASLAPKDKYPKALRLYREALKIDPKNKEALDNKKMIEDIYKSMGRPIPN